MAQPSGGQSPMALWRHSLLFCPRNHYIRYPQPRETLQAAAFSARFSTMSRRLASVMRPAFHAGSSHPQPSPARVAAVRSWNVQKRLWRSSRSGFYCMFWHLMQSSSQVNETERLVEKDFPTQDFKEAKLQVLGVINLFYYYKRQRGTPNPFIPIWENALRAKEIKNLPD